uniref:F5/8 type C domain-containing protein n=1 Tax=Dicentrarchus labrax TaxID=13489 RepID=A0A8P4FWQ5_DICLA
MHVLKSRYNNTTVFHVHLVNVLHRMMTLAVVIVLAVLGRTSGLFDTNIARFGKVTQSSLYGNAVPERAIDGNRASNWGQGSCTHTKQDKNPWWSLDLLKTYKINTVTITNRRDCCYKRINGAEIRIGNSLNNNGNDNPRCTVISSISPGTSKTFKCHGMEGRYVSIVIPGRREYLTLCEVEVTGNPSSNIAPIDTNIARFGKVTQSSLYGNAVPERAIDGNRASNWGQGSCTHTKQDKNPWWSLDLLKTYKINTVTITNRRDCCSKRINGAEIRIGNSLNNNGNDNPRCTVISSVSPGTSKTFKCNGMEGRYVSIVIPGRSEYLTLCEVEVTGNPSSNIAPIDTNIARFGKVTQSSLYGNAVPERAIDGNRASNWGQGSCTHTKQDKNPWWSLDLLKTYKINTVTITNRRDCCYKRINGAEIRIGNSLNNNGNDNPRCTVISSISPGTSKTFKCNGMEGRYVSIVIPGRREYLTLCEVEVTGNPSSNIAPIDTNIARFGKVTQSSLYGNAVPERAIDGNRASNWGQGSCTHTKQDKNPWWSLDLLKTYKINTVTITNRRDCCFKRINGAEIRIGNSLNNNGNDNPRCTVISSISPGTSKTFTCNGMEGRYVSIVIPGRREYLTLCEVEVSGTESDDDIEYACN